EQQHHEDEHRHRAEDLGDTRHRYAHARVIGHPPDRQHEPEDETADRGGSEGGESRPERLTDAHPHRAEAEDVPLLSGELPRGGEAVDHEGEPAQHEKHGEHREDAVAQDRPWPRHIVENGCHRAILQTVSSRRCTKLKTNTSATKITATQSRTTSAFSPRSLR